MDTVAIEFEWSPGETKRHVLLPARRYEQSGREINVTPESIAQMIANHTIKRPITIAHPDLSSAEAVGWIVGLELGEHNGTAALVGVVEWSEDTAHAIEAKKYGYISPVFATERKDEAGNEIGAALLAAGVTNSPHWSSDQPELWAAFCAAIEQPAAKDAAMEDDMQELEKAQARIAELEASIVKMTDENAKQAAALEAKNAEVEKFTAEANDVSQLREQVRDLTAERRIAAVQHKLLTTHLVRDGQPTELAMAAREDDGTRFEFMASLIPEPTDNTTQVGGVGEGVDAEANARRMAAAFCDKNSNSQYVSVLARAREAVATGTTLEV